MWRKTYPLWLPYVDSRVLFLKSGYSLTWDNLKIIPIHCATKAYCQHSTREIRDMTALHHDCGPSLVLCWRILRFNLSPNEEDRRKPNDGRAQGFNAWHCISTVKPIQSQYGKSWGFQCLPRNYTTETSYEVEDGTR